MIGELPLAAHEIGAIALVDFAEREVLVLGAEQVDDAVDRQVEGADLLLRKLDVDLPAQAALDGDGGDAGHAFEPLRQVVLGDLAQLDAVVVALDADAHDRHRGRVELEDRRRVRVLRQPSAHPVDAAAHVVCGLVQVHAPGEVQGDAAVAFRGGRLEALEARDRRHGLLDRPRDELFHLERPDAGVADAHRDARIRHIRHQVDRKAGEGHCPDQDDHARKHEHRDGTLDC